MIRWWNSHVWPQIFFSLSRTTHKTEPTTHARLIIYSPHYGGSWPPTLPLHKAPSTSQAQELPQNQQRDEHPVFNPVRDRRGIGRAGSVRSENKVRGWGAREGLHDALLSENGKVCGGAQIREEEE